MKHYKMLLIVLSSLCGAAYLFGGNIEEHGLGVSLPADWLPLGLGDSYNGVAGYCDSGQVTFMIEKKPFDQKSRLGQLDKEIASGAMETELKTLAIFRGHGFRKAGKNKDGDIINYTLFFPR